MSFIIGTMLYLSLSYFCLPGNAYAYDPVGLYDLVDVFSINCGSSGNSTEGYRTWIGDMDYEFLLFTNESQPENASVPASPIRQSPSANTVPYTTARLSYSNFTFSFPVTAGHKFIRLYFYPTSYELGFNRSQALFSVISGTFTLLKDFNASLTADADEDSSVTIFREYIISVDEGQRLSLTFSASKIQPDLYAFVNGMEILSMPTNLYYTDSGSLGFELVGSRNLLNIANSSALKTEYRLNVGGSEISPIYDTGLLRYWENDQKYVTTPSALPADFRGSKLRFTQVPNYTAPDPVYRTARSMGTNGTLNKISNLTWEFSVDSGFTYMLRLHFCELDPLIKFPGDRVLYIYIDDKLAEHDADVLEWSMEKGVPVYRDYAVPILGNEKKSTLSLKLHPGAKTTYSDAVLNGLEIFRISDPQSNNLDGPNLDPFPSTPVTPPKPIQKANKRRIKTIIATVSSVVSCVTLLFLVACYVNRQGKKVKDTKPGEGSSSIPSYICRHFSIAEIRVATENFNEHFIIGKVGLVTCTKGTSTMPPFLLPSKG